MAVDNKKIAKNTVFMYLRLMVTIPLAFYTSRVVLKELGVADYGIYQAAAGIITMFAILRTAFDSATQRYYNVALANNDDVQLSKMFSASVVIQVIMAISLVALIELFGIWFIEHEMQYPIDRRDDVFFVFHTTVLSVIFIVLNIPFTGMIIAKEHMKFYAYIAIIDVVLKLALVFILIFFTENKLRLYAVFQMSVPIFLFVIGVLYFRKNFKEVKFRRFNRQLIKEMSTFSGWGLCGNICYSLVNEGVNLLLNVYGGVIANAARGIAFQVRGVLANVLTTTIMPVRPQATQLFIKEEYDNFWVLIYTYSKILFLLCSIMVIPITVFAGQILLLWLGFIPEYSSIFLQLLMCYTLIRSFHEPIDIVFKASGRMKVYQLTTIVISSMTFFLGWLFLYLRFPIYTPFIVFCIIEALLLLVLIVKARKDGMNIKIYFCNVLLPCIFYALPSFAISYIISLIIHNWFIGVGLSIVNLLVLAYYIGLNRSERNLLNSKIKIRFRRNRV